MFFEFSVNWEKELDSLVGAHRLVVPTAVIQELQILATRNRGQKKATAALKLIEKYETIDADAVSADDALLKIAEKTQGVVVTNDAELRKRLKNRGFSVIFLRGKKKLVLDE
jgi:rRNA-processing protein FCF1